MQHCRYKDLNPRPLLTPRPNQASKRYSLLLHYFSRSDQGRVSNLPPLIFSPIRGRRENCLVKKILMEKLLPGKISILAATRGPNNETISAVAKKKLEIIEIVFFWTIFSRKFSAAPVPRRAGLSRLCSNDRRGNLDRFETDVRGSAIGLEQP